MRRILAVAFAVSFVILIPATAIQAEERVLDTRTECSDPGAWQYESWNEDQGDASYYGERYRRTSDCERTSDNAAVEVSDNGETVASVATGSRAHTTTRSDEGWSEEAADERCTSPFDNSTQPCDGRYSYWSFQHTERSTANGAWAEAGGQQAFVGDECESTDTFDFAGNGTWDFRTDEYDWYFDDKTYGSDSCRTGADAAGHEVALSACDSAGLFRVQQTPEDAWLDGFGHRSCRHGPEISESVEGTGTALDGTSVSWSSVVEENRSCETATCSRIEDATAHVDADATAGGGDFHADGSFPLLA